jgi:hypothetical protein
VPGSCLADEPPLPRSIGALGCAEANGGLVRTLDSRDFGVVAREGTIALVPEGR